MAKIKYIGENNETSTQGYDFVKGQEVDVTNDEVITRLKYNPFFEVHEEKKSKKTDNKTPKETGK